jgi:single-stranded DNA-binding protein
VINGKVSRLGKLSYTPGGIAVLEITLAAPQLSFDKESVGYFEVLICGNLAEGVGPKLRVGQRVQLAGALWSRTFKDRQSNRVNETKIIAHSIEGDTK